MRVFTLALASACFIAAGCVKQQPQLPANKGNATDQTTLALTQANEKLIEAEDSLLAEYVAQQTESYQKTENGYWYRIIKTENKQAAEKREVKYSSFSLENELLLSEEKTIIPGKKELIAALDHFTLTHPEAIQASLIIPWHQAYGVSGQSPEINAYQSVKAEIFILR